MPTNQAVIICWLVACTTVFLELEQRKTSVIFSPLYRHFQDFFFSHFTLIDAHLEHLKEGVEEACHNRGAFTATVIKVTMVTNGRGSHCSF